MRMIEALAWLGSRIGKPRGWERVVRLLASPERFRGARDVRLVRDGMAFIAQPSVPLGWYVTLFGTYEPELRELFRSVVPEGGVVVDVGANVGWHTLLLASRVGSRGKVFAVEANPSVRERLEENIALNRLGQVQVIPYALADKTGEAAFFGPSAKDAGSGNGHLMTGAEPGRPDGIRVETRRFDELLPEATLGRLDLIKIDVEGHEWPVLQGAEGAIARFRPHITFEYIEEYALRGGGTPARLAEFFTRHRYRLFTVGREGRTALEPGCWPRCADVWAMPL